MRVGAELVIHVRFEVSCLLPPKDKGVAGFYEVVPDRLKQDYSARLEVNAREEELLREILGQDGWSLAYGARWENPEAAVAYVRQMVKEQCWSGSGLVTVTRSR